MSPSGRCRYVSASGARRTSTHACRGAVLSLEAIREQPLAVFDQRLPQKEALATRGRLGTRAKSRQVAVPALTRRESEILAHLSKGESDEEISASLDIRPVTTKKHGQRLLVKLGARSRTEAAIMAARDTLRPSRPAAPSALVRRPRTSSSRTNSKGHAQSR